MNQLRVLPTILHFIHGPHSITSQESLNFLRLLVFWRNHICAFTRVSLSLISPSPPLTLQTGPCWNRLAPHTEFGIIPSNFPLFSFPILDSTVLLHYNTKKRKKKYIPQIVFQN